MASGSTSGTQRDLTFLGQLLEKVVYKSDAKWSDQRNLSQDTRDTVEHIAAARYRMKLREYWAMRDTFQANQIRFRTDKFLWLPPLENNSDFVPILYGSCNLKASVADLQLELHSYSSKKSEPHAIAFRFESPNQGPPHDYWHIQLVAKSYFLQEIPGCPDWLPDKVPAFPVKVRDPVGAFLSILVSLYGANFVLKILSSMNALPEYFLRLKEVS